MSRRSRLIRRRAAPITSELAYPRQVSLPTSAAALRLPLLDVLAEQAVHVEHLGWPGVRYCMAVVQGALALERS